MSSLASITIALVFASTVMAGDLECSSYEVDGGTLDLAPLPGFVEACSRNTMLCDVLTRSYPSGITTLGYFVTEDDWARFLETQELGFRVYLIAQTSGRKSDEEFEQLKNYVKAQQGQLPDNTELPSFIEKHGQASLGILSETDDSIAFGTVMQLATAQGASTLAASNVALQLPSHSLILYVYHNYEGPSDIDKLRELTRRWSDCLRSQNEAPRAN